MGWMAQKKKYFHFFACFGGRMADWRMRNGLMPEWAMALSSHSPHGPSGRRTHGRSRHGRMAAWPPGRMADGRMGDGCMADGRMTDGCMGLWRGHIWLLVCGWMDHGRWPRFFLNFYFFNL